MHSIFKSAQLAALNSYLLKERAINLTSFPNPQIKSCLDSRSPSRRITIVERLQRWLTGGRVDRNSLAYYTCRWAGILQLSVFAGSLALLFSH